MKTPLLLKNKPPQQGGQTSFGKKKAPTTYQADGAFAEQNAKRAALLFSPKLALNGSVFESFGPQLPACSKKMGGGL
jgi:hypothetical protein